MLPESTLTPTNLINFTQEYNVEEKYWTDLAVENHNGMTINEIMQNKSKNIKVNLFIGRTPKEELPERTSDTIWVSLNIVQTSDCLKSITTDRLHLIMDCNNTSQMKTIQSLFNSVVVDLSTRKFFSDEGLFNIYNTVQKGGDLLIEKSLSGGVLKIEDQRADMRKRSEYRKNFNRFVADFFQNKFDITVDTSRVKRAITDDQQITDNKNSVIELPEYKEWKVTNTNQYFDEMRCFFIYLAEQQGIIEPAVVLSREQNLAELKTRTNEMLQCFDKVEFLKEKYPYKNNCDNDGQGKVEYFHALGKKKEGSEGRVRGDLLTY